jgi:cobalt-zinc-cadmium efflux system protein
MSACHGAARGDHARPIGARLGEERRLLVAFVLISAFLVVELVGALLSGSLALLADAGHMSADALALGMAAWAARLARRPAQGRWTYGFRRAEILSAGLNGILLAMVAAVVAAEAVQRLVHPVPVEGSVVLAVALAGIAANLASVLVLAGFRHSTLNAEGAFQHVAVDLVGFVATALAGALILGLGLQRADAVASLVVVILMARSAASLIRRSSRVLLEAAPEGVDLGLVQAHLLGSAHVQGVHDLHAWSVSSDLPVLSAHVVIADACFRDGHAPEILDALQACLAGHFDVEHSTFQLEPASHVAHERSAH